MAKFSGKQQLWLTPQAVIKTTSSVPDISTYEGGAGYSRDAKSELFLLAVSNMVGEDTFYEARNERDARFRDLVVKVTASDPDWVARFVPFLRNEMFMRSASTVMAAEYAAAGGPNPRRVVDSALQRPDEPAEFLAYWKLRFGGTPSGGVLRGVADAVVRLYNERAALKYDGQGRAWRMGDVVELVHPKPKAAWQSALFRFLIDVRHNREDAWKRAAENELTILGAHHRLRMIPQGQRRSLLRLSPSTVFAEAGMTWEALSGWLGGPMDAEAWEKIIPSMGYMALLRNLRNFDEARVSDEVAAKVAAKLADPDEVARSKQFPLRFLSAYKNAPSLRWAAALEAGLQHSLASVPSLNGRTLILVDTSGSMFGGWSQHSTLERWEQAALFGIALAARAEDAEVVSFDMRSQVFPLVRAESVLKSLERFRSGYALGGGTDTIGAITSHYDHHDRVVILTDEQTFDTRYLAWESRSAEYAVTSIKAPIYTFNVAGYKAGHLPSGEGNRYTFGGGLTDRAFQMLALLDARREGIWPF